MIKQTGLLFKIVPSDYITGSSPLVGVEVNPLKDWREYLPSEEKQYKDFTFDTMSCTTFSVINCVETQINFFIKNNKLNDYQLSILKEYIDENGKVNFSDRFTAIMSGTSPQGNYFQNVWDSVRKHGLLPEKDFPFGGNSWSEYHDATKITDAMKDKAKKILQIFNFNYEWLTFLPENYLVIKEHLAHAPIHGAIPYPATHAIEIPHYNYIFDTYVPFLYKRSSKVHYTMKGVVSIKMSYTYFSQAEVDKWKLKPELWAKLDEARALAGIPFIITSGLRTVAQNTAVGGTPNSAHLTGEAADISCVDSRSRWKMVNAFLKVGFNRLEVAKKHLHVDISKGLPQEIFDYTTLD